MGLVQQMKAHPKRGLKFAALVPGILISGISMAIIGPTLLDLQHQVNTTTSGIAFVLTSRAVGSVIGSVACGVIGSRFNLLLMTGVASLLGAACTASYGFLTDVDILMGVSVVYGLSYGYMCAAQIALITQLWGQEAPPFQQTLSFLFSVGQVVAPIIAAPFLVRMDPHDDESSDQETRIYVPYFVLAASMVLYSVLASIVWCYDPDSSDHPSRVTTRNNDSLTGQQKTRLWSWKSVVVICFAIGVHINSGVEIVMGQFLVTYAYKTPLHLPKATGAHMTTMSYTLFAVKNLVAILYVPFIGDRANIVLSSCTVLTGSLFLIFLGQTSELSLWIGSAVVSMGDGSIYASTLGVMEGLFPVTPRISSVLTFAYVSGEFTIPAIASFVIEDQPEMLMMIVFACSLTMLLMFLIVTLISSCKVL